MFRWSEEGKRNHDTSLEILSRMTPEQLTPGKRALDSTDSYKVGHYGPEIVTPMKQEYFNMLVVWRTNNPKISTAALAENLQKRFALAAGPAFILASRFKNELHTQGLL